MQIKRKNMYNVAYGMVLSLTVQCWAPLAIRAEDAAVSGDAISMTPIEVTDDKIKKPPPADGSEAQGYRLGAAQVGPLGNWLLKDTPFSIHAVSADFLKNTQAQTIADVLKYDPTVQAKTGASRISDHFNIRGFGQSAVLVAGNGSDTTVDGMLSFNFIEPLEDKERVDLMNGATGLLYGFSSLGGTINYVTKKPTDKPLADITLGNSGGQQVYLHGDFGGLLDKNGKLAYRLNVLQSTDGDSELEHQTDKTGLVSAALDWHIKPDTRWSFDAAYFHRDLQYAQATFVFGAGALLPTVVPAAPDTSKNWGAPASFASDTFSRYSTQYQTKLSNTLTLRAAARYTDMTRSYGLYREELVNNASDYKLNVIQQDPFQILLTQGNAFLDSRFTTGTIKHALSVGWTGNFLESKYSPFGYKTGLSTTIYPANIYSGVASYVPYPTLTVSDSSNEKLSLQSLILVDTMEFNHAWSLMLGGNDVHIHDKTWDITKAGPVTEYDQSKFSPSAALMYKPSPNVTLYTSYMQALEKGATVSDPLAPNNGQTFAPYVSNQWEVGVKSTVGAVDISAALFHIEQQAYYSLKTTHVYAADGREIHQGGEVMFSGKVNPHLMLGGGVTLLHPWIAKSSTAGAAGHVPSGVADTTGRLYMEYTLPSAPNWTLTGGLSYTSSEWLDTANTLSVPSVVLADVGVRYKTKMAGRDVTFRLNVDNLTGKNYWTPRPGLLYLGHPRTIACSMETKF